ncbi:MarR family transcriptional regulator [Gordonia sp. CPCC 205515]|uniref:MarR family winged helix-turn-helix transcriptional regulator n=1 Tax=Gordonia sp. CPCC 205515 TaxID=3140791 RepID=UPI003AF3558A
MADDPRAVAWRPFVETTARLHAMLDDDLKSSSGMSMSDYSILLLLHEAPGGRLRMREIADAMVFSTSRLSYQIDTMCRNGWLRRERASEDRRGSYAVLTDDGRAAFEKAAIQHADCVRRIYFEALAPEDGIALQRIMSRLAHRLADR